MINEKDAEAYLKEFRNKLRAGKDPLYAGVGQAIEASWRDGYFRGYERYLREAVQATSPDRHVECGLAWFIAATLPPSHALMSACVAGNVLGYVFRGGRSDTRLEEELKERLIEVKNSGKSVVGACVLWLIALTYPPKQATLSLPRQQVKCYLASCDSWATDTSAVNATIS